MKKKCPEFENHERWLVSYADMVTLLFAVFVVLYAIQIAGQKKDKTVAGSMQESFNKPLEDIPIDRRVPGSQEAGKGVFANFRGDTIRPPMIEKLPSVDKLAIINEEMKQAKIEIERLYGPNKFRGADKPGFERIIEVKRTEKGFKLTLMGRYFYKPGGTKISRNSIPELDHVIKTLRKLDRPVTIEGHTDSMKPAGKLDNLSLSSVRAANILTYMMQEHSFPVSLLSIAGYGELKPVASNGSSVGRALNRRIEFHVEYDDDDRTL